MTTKTLLEVKALNAYYGRAQILFGIDLQVRAGEVVALMGRNGAGKSTTMKSIMAMVRRRSGSVVFRGQEVSKLQSHQISRLGLGFVPEERRIFSDLTVMENLSVGVQPAREGMRTWTTEALFRMFPNLGQMQQRPGGQMSGGEQQMLTVARTLMGNPYLVMLDEPSEGVAPVIVEQMAHMIHQLKSQGLCVLLSEQNIHFASLVADRAYVLERGQVRFSGDMHELIADKHIRSQYLSL
ncbi:ABC transporter ATP-binding protein [Ottowia thiooxydans]|uniref:Branched-chain amino acid transport system ATP-binding protein n=1 Tax=Ottowia thiooxydans TaxID=219182 RepID=A0ABV2QE06_9BURK